MNSKFGSCTIPESTSRIVMEGKKKGRRKFYIAGPVEDRGNFSERAAKLQLRLKSFQNPNWKSEKSIYQLANAGFRYTGEGDRVECEECSKRVYKWSIEDDPLETHFRIAPQCPFMIELGYTLDHQIPKYRRYCNHGKRLATMINIPDRFRNDIPPFESLARAGFFYQGTLDRMSCFHCGLVLRDWEKDTDPIEVHDQFQKKCLFITNLLEYARSGQLVEIVVKDSQDRKVLNQANGSQNNSTKTPSCKTTGQLQLKNIGVTNSQHRSRQIEVADSKMTTSSPPSFFVEMQKLKSENDQPTIPRQPTEIRHLRRIGKYANMTKQELERFEIDMVDGRNFSQASILPSRQPSERPTQLSPYIQSSTTAKAECVTSNSQSNPAITPVEEAVHEMGYSLDLIYQAINERRERGEGDFPDATSLCLAVMDLAEKSS